MDSMAAKDSNLPIEWVDWNPLRKRKWKLSLSNSSKMTNFCSLKERWEKQWQKKAKRSQNSNKNKNSITCSKANQIQFWPRIWKDWGNKMRSLNFWSIRRIKKSTERMLGMWSNQSKIPTRWRISSCRIRLKGYTLSMPSHLTNYL